MKQGNNSQKESSGFHVAIIMDGNGRWAETQGLPRSAGHHAGVGAVRRVVRAAPTMGITTLTLYAFSANNWGRPGREVDALMDIFRSYFIANTEEWVAHGIRVKVIGRRDRISSMLLEAVVAAEALTDQKRSLDLRIALDYSARESILWAARRLNEERNVSQETFSRLLGSDHGSGQMVSDVDLLIRCGGENRLSDFLLWECAYAELVFTQTMWPDFTDSDLRAAVEEFHSRDRRFGRLRESISDWEIKSKTPDPKSKNGTSVFHNLL